MLFIGMGMFGRRAEGCVLVGSQEFSLGHNLFELSVVHLNGEVEEIIRLSLEFMVETKAGDLTLGVFCIETVF